MTTSINYGVEFIAAEQFLHLALKSEVKSHLFARQGVAACQSISMTQTLFPPWRQSAGLQAYRACLRPLAPQG